MLRAAGADLPLPARTARVFPRSSPSIRDRRAFDPRCRATSRSFCCSARASRRYASCPPSPTTCSASSITTGARAAGVLRRASRTARPVAAAALALAALAIVVLPLRAGASPRARATWSRARSRPRANADKLTGLRERIRPRSRLRDMDKLAPGRRPRPKPLFAVQRSWSSRRERDDAWREVVVHRGGDTLRRRAGPPRVRLGCVRRVLRRRGAA